MKFKNLSIKWQIIIIIALMSLPFVLLSLHNLGKDRKKQSESAKNLAISIARNIGMQQKKSEANTRQVLSLISKLPELKSPVLDNEKLNLLYKTVLSENPQFVVILSALPNGDVNASAIPFNPFSVADRKYFKDVMRTRSFSVGEFARSRLTNRPVLHYAIPVLDAADSIKLVLIASFDLAQYHNLLSVSSLPKGSDFAFYDYNGRILYHSKIQQKLLGKRDPQKIRNAILATTDEGWYIARDESNIERIYGFIRVNIDKNSPYMYIVVSAPLAEVLKDSNLKFFKNFALTIFAIAFSVIIFIFYKKFVLKKIDKLVFVANKFRDGDFTVRTDIDYEEGEIGALAKSLDHMAEAVHTRQIEKDTINKNLKRVSERLEIAVSSAKVGIWEWDLLTGKIFWNEQMFDLYNLESINFKGTLTDWMKHLHPDDAVRFDEELHHSIKNKRNHKTSFRILNKQKGYKNIRCYFTLLYDNNGKASHITGVNLDITERIFLENELSHTKESMTSKIEMLKSDLNTSLTMLNDKLHILVKKLGKENITPDQENSEYFTKQITDWIEDISEEINQIIRKI